ncbi:MAG: hypothetical protein ABFD11_04685 [Christensenella sp.]
MSELKIGWASRDVSTQEPVNLYGQYHMRISEGVRDAVTVTALVLDDGEDLAALVSADICFYVGGILDSVRALVQHRIPQFPVEKIVLSATHTHSAPALVDGMPWDGVMLGDELPPLGGLRVAKTEAYREFFVERIAQAVCEAYEKRSPGGAAYGYGFAVVGHSRRVVYFDDLSLREPPPLPPASPEEPLSSREDRLLRVFDNIDGFASMYGQTNDRMFSHYEGGADPYVNLLYTFDTNGTLTGALINVACPSQNSELLGAISADFWHEARCELRRRHGGIFLLPQCAAAGDASPRQLHYKVAQDRRYRLKYGDGDREDNTRKDIAQRIAEVFDEVLSWAGKDIQTELPLKHAVREIQLSRRMVSEEDRAECLRGLETLNAIGFLNDLTPEENLEYNSILLSGIRRYQAVLNRYEQQKTESCLPVELHVIRLGDIAFATNPYELYIDFQHRIQARSPATQTFLSQLCAQPGLTGGSYLCTERAEWGGSYSASVYCCTVSAKGGQELVEATVQTLEELWAE